MTSPSAHTPHTAAILENGGVNEADYYLINYANELKTKKFNEKWGGFSTILTAETPFWRTRGLMKMINT